MLNGDALGLKMLQYVDALSEEEKRDREKVFKAMGRAIVDYLKQNLEVQLADVLVQALSSAAVAPNDGGATLKTNLASLIGGNPNAKKVR